jgi:hypothetical protein
MNVMKATVKRRVWNIELRSFCLDVDFEAISLLASKLMTAFLETCFLFCFFLTPGWGHAAGKAKKVASNVCITLACPGGA